MDLKQRDEKLYKTYTTLLYSPKSQKDVEIEEMRLSLIPDEQLTEEGPSRELMQNLANEAEHLQPLSFSLQDILQTWLKDFIKKNPKYRHHQNLSVYEVIEPDSVLDHEKLVITPRITQNLQDLTGGLNGKVLIESIRGQNYFIYESADHKLFYINPNMLSSGLQGIGFEISETLSGILKKKIHSKKNVDLVIQDDQFLYKASSKSDYLEPTKVLFNILEKPVSFMSRFNENNSERVFSIPVSEELIRKINDIQRNTSYNQFLVHHNGEEIRFHLHSQSLEDSLEIHRFNCGVPAMDHESVYHLGDYLCNITAKSFSLLKNGVFIVDLQKESMVIVICKSEQF